MISFQQACVEVGYDNSTKRPEQIYTYFAYKGGQAREFQCLQDAKAFSDNVEKSLVNKAEIDGFKDRQRTLERAAMDNWLVNLRREYPDLNIEQFQLIYKHAYEDACDNGYDEIADRFESLHSVCVAFYEAGNIVW